MESNRSQIMTIPGAIIIAGALIALAVIWTQKPATPKSPAPNTLVANQLAPINMSPISSADHILGNPDAAIKIVEYSDPSCQYCKSFNPTMYRIMNEYGTSGKVAWIYRSFPFDQPDQNGDILHPNAGRQSQGLECAASVGGNAKFWAYEKQWYDEFPEDQTHRSVELDQKEMVRIAKANNIDVVAFNECLSSSQFKSKVESQFRDGLNAGVTGTPTSFIITPSGNTLTVVGAQPYAKIKSAIDTLLTSQNSK